MEKNYEDLTLKELFEVYNKFSKISDEYSEKVKSADKIKSELKNIIWERVGKQKTKMNDFTIYQMTQVKFDSNAFKEENPDIYNKYKNKVVNIVCILSIEKENWYYGCSNLLMVHVQNSKLGTFML